MISLRSLALILVVLAPVSLHAEEAPALPDGKELLQKMNDAMGCDALAKTKNMQIQGTFSMPAQKIEGKLELKGAPPDMQLLSMEMPGLGALLGGYDGTNAWSSNPVEGPRILEGDVAASAAFDASYLGECDLSRYPEITTTEKTEFDGRAAYAISVVPTVGNPRTFFIDAENSMPLGSKRVEKTPMGDIPVTITNRGFKQFEGVTVPGSTQQEMMGMVQVMTFDSVKFNVEPAPDFSLPAEVKALLEDSKTSDVKDGTAE